jgi:transposase
LRGHRLRAEEIVTLNVLADKGSTNSEIARLLGVTEGAVRYQLAKPADSNGNAKAYKAHAFAEVIDHWMKTKGEGRRPANIKDLFEYLITEFDYASSYKSVLRYVRAYYPKPRLRTFRRVETPPGAQTQTDWGEYPGVRIAGETVDLHAFVMVLSHSRMPVVVWSRSENQLAWLQCHNSAYTRLGGIAAVNRIDNVKTAIAQGAGAWGTINDTFRAYARSVGFHVDACQPRAANAKGKVEAKVKLSRFLIDPQDKDWISLEALQSASDLRIERWTKRTLCPATGKSIWESWHDEKELLRKLPILPEAFDVVVTRPVHRDCSVNFEGRSYPVPFEYVGSLVEVRGCAEKVQILAMGRVIKEHPRGTAQRVLTDQSCYEGKATDTVLPPLPLGKMGKRLQEILEMDVEKRPIDLYAALAGVAR